MTNITLYASWTMIARLYCMRKVLRSHRHATVPLRSIDGLGLMAFWPSAFPVVFSARPSQYERVGARLACLSSNSTPQLNGWLNGRLAWCDPKSPTSMKSSWTAAWLVSKTINWSRRFPWWMRHVWKYLLDCRLDTPLGGINNVSILLGFNRLVMALRRPQSSSRPAILQNGPCSFYGSSNL